MISKSILLLLVVALSFLAQPLLRLIDNDFYYYATCAFKFLLLISVTASVIWHLATKRDGSILLVIYLILNLVLYYFNLLLLDSNTMLYGVAENPNYQMVHMIRWAGTFNLSFFYNVIEFLIIIQGVWGVGKHISVRFMDWIRDLLSKHCYSRLCYL